MKESLMSFLILLTIIILIGSLIGLITLSIGVLIGNLTFYVSEFVKKKIKNFKHHFNKSPTGIWYYYKGYKYYSNNKKELK
jgi:ABC-type multidrug transport system fused ATPase/permease subunit